MFVLAWIERDEIRGFAVKNAATYSFEGTQLRLFDTEQDALALARQRSVNLTPISIKELDTIFEYDLISEEAESDPLYTVDSFIRALELAHELELFVDMV